MVRRLPPAISNCLFQTIQTILLRICNIGFIIGVWSLLQLESIPIAAAYVDILNYWHWGREYILHFWFLLTMEDLRKRSGHKTNRQVEDGGKNPKDVNEHENVSDVAIVFNLAHRECLEDRICCTTEMFLCQEQSGHLLQKVLPGVLSEQQRIQWWRTTYIGF